MEGDFVFYTMFAELNLQINIYFLTDIYFLTVEIKMFW